VTVLLVIVALVLAVAAVVLASDRRAMVIGIGIGSALVVALMPPLLRFADSVITNHIASAGMSVVAGAFVDSIVEAVSWPLRVVAAVFLAIGVVGLVAGPRGQGFAAIGRRPAAALPLALGALLFLIVWIVVGPDAALIGLALVAAVLWIRGRPVIADRVPEVAGSAA